MKNRILKGIWSEEEKSDCEKENTVQNRFQTVKAAGTATQPPAAVPQTEQLKVYFAVSLWKWSWLLSTCISPSKYEDSIQFLLVYSSKNYVYFKLFFGPILYAMLLDR